MVVELGVYLKEEAAGNEKDAKLGEEKVCFVKWDLLKRLKHYTNIQTHS